MTDSPLRKTSVNPVNAARARERPHMRLSRYHRIEGMTLLPEKEGDPLEVSDADTMLKYINPRAVAPEPMVIFAKPGCPRCACAKALLDSLGYSYDEISLGKQVTLSTLRAVSGSATSPQVFIGGKLIGNADDLEAYFDARKAA